MNEQKLTAADLRQFIGTENWYRHAMVKSILYTDGIQYLARKAGAYWLIDHIALHQAHPKFKQEIFQTWVFRVDLQSSAGVLTCTDGNKKVISVTQLSYTDFPLAEITIYVTDNVIMLPSEY